MRTLKAAAVLAVGVLTLGLPFGQGGAARARAQTPAPSQPQPSMPEPTRPKTISPAQTSSPQETAPVQQAPRIEPQQIQPPKTPPLPESAPPAGKILFSTDRPPVTDPDPDQAAVSSSVPEPRPGVPDVLPKTLVTDAERASVLITSYDLDLHFIPASARDETHAAIMLRNVSAAPLWRIPLQISSSLRWQTISAMSAGGLTAIPFTQSPIATDTDHTGYAQEAVLTLPEPLAPGGTISLSAFFAGEIRQSGARLELLGTAADRAERADWDQIAPTTDDSATGLRGFGNVLWYPVAAPTALLGDGNKVLEVVGRQRLKEAAATIRLRLTVEYAGDPPVAAIFDGEVQPLAATPDEQDQVVADTHGLATAAFAARKVGFRAPSLFLTAQQPTATEGQALSVITPRLDAIAPYAEAARSVQPMLGDWFGVTPIAPLTLLDHAGDPFEDDALLVMDLQADAKPAELAAALVPALTHAWFHTSHAWISEGLAEFMSLLWTERTKGSEAALAELAEQANVVALAEPDLSAALVGGERPDAQGGEPLVAASSPVFFRSKAAAVWWQLREIVGEDLLRQALVAYRHSESVNPGFDADAKAMQNTLERVTGKELGWFFNDWVYNDRSLPDLTIVQVSAHGLPARPGKNSGYLVAVEVRNEGYAEAEVPVTVRSGTLTATERLRVAARSVASTRIVFEGTPTTVLVNDGSTPELRVSTHTRAVEIQQ